MVDEFHLQFHSDPSLLNVYKKELNSHVESGLGSNLRARLSNALAMNIDQSQREMIEKVATLLPENKRTMNVTNSNCEPFEVLYRLHCDNLCGDFHENLEFKFSWGLSKLVTRVSSLANWSRGQTNILMVSLICSDSLKCILIQIILNILLKNTFLNIFLIMSNRYIILILINKIKVIYYFSIIIKL